MILFPIPNFAHDLVGRWLPMLRGVIKSLYEHYGLDPEAYTTARIEKTQKMMIKLGYQRIGP